MSNYREHPSVEKLYNKDIKLDYIDNYFGEETTKLGILYEFLKSAEVERQKEKDLFAFFEDDIVDLLYNLKSSNLNSIEKSVSIYKDYVNWCKENNKRGHYENGENNVSFFQGYNNVREYISNRKISKSILTKKELMNLINSLVNMVDKAYVVALYELIGGDSLHELRHLSIRDVEQALEIGDLELKNEDGSRRVCRLSKEVLKLFKTAYEEKTYISNNSEPDIRGNVMEKELSDSDYIFRLTKRRDTEYQPISYSATHSKMQSIKKYTGYDFLSSGSLRDTRIVHEIADTMKALDLKVPNQEVYDKAFDSIEGLYSIELSYQQRRTLVAKFEQAFTIKSY